MDLGLGINGTMGYRLETSLFIRKYLRYFLLVSLLGAFSLWADSGQLRHPNAAPAPISSEENTISNRPLVKTSTTKPSPAEIAFQVLVSNNTTMREQDLIQFIADYPDSGWGEYGLGLLSLDQTEFEKARNYFFDAITKEPTQVTFRLGLASVYEKEHKFFEALDVVNRHLYRYPNDLRLRLARANYAFLVGRYEVAKTDIEFVYREEPSNLQAIWLEVLILQATNNFTSAINRLKTYLQLSTENSTAWSKSCELHIQEFNQKPYSIASLKYGEQDCLKAIKLNPEYSEGYYFLARLYEQREWVVHALWYDQKALELSPFSENSSHGKHALQMMLGQVSENYSSIELVHPTDRVYALNDLKDKEKKQFIKPHHMKAWKLLAKAAVEKDKNSVTAVSNAIYQASNFAPSYYTRGLIGLSKCCGTDPEADFLKAIALEPSWGRPYTALVAYYMAEKNFFKAREIVNQSLALDSGSKIAKYNGKLLKMFDESVVNYTVKELKALESSVLNSEVADLDNFPVYIGVLQGNLYGDPTTPLHLRRLSFNDPVLIEQANRNRKHFSQKETGVMIGKYSGYLRRDPTSSQIFEAFGDVLAADPRGQMGLIAMGYYQKAIELGGSIDTLTEKIEKIRPVRTY